MKLIKSFNGIDLAISKVMRNTLWPTPGTLVDERGELVHLEYPAMEQVAAMANLDVKSALVLATIDQPRWKLFGDIFATSDDSNDRSLLCLTNKEQNNIYSFLSMDLESETEELAELFDLLDRKQIKFKTGFNASTDETTIFMAIDPSPFNKENPTDDQFEILYLFNAGKRWLTVLAHKKLNDQIVNTTLLYDSYVAKRKETSPQFTMDAVDPDYAKDILTEDYPDRLDTYMEISPSLQEVISVLRTIQMTKKIATDPSDFLGIFIERYSAAPKQVTTAIHSLLGALEAYQFYYAPSHAVVKNRDLLLDPLKEIKAHLYIAEDIRLTDLFGYLTTFILAELDFIRQRIIKDEERSTEVGYLLTLSRYLTKLIKQSPERYDAVKIPEFYVED